MHRGRAQPGVVKAVYLAAFLLGPGESFASKTQGNEPPYFTVRDGFDTCPEPKEWLYNDVPDDFAEDAARHLARCSRTMSEDIVDAVSWHEIPSVYIVCGKDKALPPAIAEWVLAAAGVSWDIVRLEASHSPFLSMPDRLVAVIRWAAGEKNVDMEGVEFDDKRIDPEKASKEAGWTESTMAEVETM